MTYNEVYVPSRGKDPNKFKSIKAFSKYSATQKLIAEHFRMTGKVGTFIRQKAIDMIEEGSNYNGYGYQDHTKMYLLSVKDGKTLLEMLHAKTENQKESKCLTDEEKKIAWAKRLVKFVPDLELEEAIEIADEKLDYKDRQIDELENRQYKLRYSVKRDKLIDKIRRSNPLRRIEDKEHAERIMAASKRHNCTFYEGMLERGRRLADMGEIDYEDIKDYARTHMNGDYE